jgi:hypothetical protein
MKILPFVLLFSGILNQGYCQILNYAEIFGDDWQKATVFEAENRKWMQPFLQRNNISYPEAIAVVFPELVRYSALRDKMETSILKTLYINLGETYANFSIGVFQMKPSFASGIRDEASHALERSSEITFRRSGTFDDIRDFRKEIVADLENPEAELKYLAAFIIVCEKKYRTDRMNQQARVKFLSTVYNCGIKNDKEEIERMSDKKFFNTKLFKTENYSYSDISLFWFNRFNAGDN